MTRHRLTVNGDVYDVHPSVRIDRSARINCDHLEIGEGSVIGRNCIVEGTRVVIGRDAWLDEGARIGGGSCHDQCAFLTAGDFLHLGKSAEVNIARGVTLGDEVGIGIESKILTHGSWLDELTGFPCSFAPVTIGSRVWLPNAWVNPGVTIGDDVVVSARSLVNKSLPSGCLAAGIPCRVVAKGAYPRVLSQTEREGILDRIIAECDGSANSCVRVGLVIVCGDKQTATFDCEARTIEGAVSGSSEVLRHQLRRHGIRFRYRPDVEWYRPWE